MPSEEIIFLLHFLDTHLSHLHEKYRPTIPSSFYKMMSINFPSAIRRTPWHYQEFTTISPWSHWTEQSSGSSTSCATKEPNISGLQPMTSPGTSTTLWMWLGSCWPVWQSLLTLSWNVAFLFIEMFLGQERRKRGIRACSCLRLLIYQSWNHSFDIKDYVSLCGRWSFSFGQTCAFLIFPDVLFLIKPLETHNSNCTDPQVILL